MLPEPELLEEFEPLDELELLLELELLEEDQELLLYEEPEDIKQPQRENEEDEYHQYSASLFRCFTDTNVGEYLMSYRYTRYRDSSTGFCKRIGCL